MEDLATALKLAADALDERLITVKKGNLADALRFYYGTRESYDEVDAQRKRIYEALENMSRATIPEMMADEGIKTITLDDIRIRFTVSQRFSCSMPDKDAGMVWLRENGLGDLIQETVNAGTLSSAAKKRIETDGLEMPGEYFRTSYMTFTSATKVK